ncbi:hypothetical protein PHMEG_0002215 [Phytophthora megakarya]|uniref:Uncharacterized protein n=1 Tax=Phytophthora megakarya TaxID=4795 RepID=A0A225WYU5_9STRA|nr:hypothetical protein PHMEG_0002215 [Phytophthora megakarya]
MTAAVREAKIKHAVKRSHSEIEVINLRHTSLNATREKNQYKRDTQGKHAKAYNTSDKNHVKEVLDICQVVIKDDFVRARTARSHRAQADESKYDYNFVIPHAFAIKLDAVLRAEENKRPPLNYFANKAIVASIAGGTPKCNSRPIDLLQEFYNIRMK